MLWPCYFAATSAGHALSFTEHGSDHVGSLQACRHQSSRYPRLRLDGMTGLDRDNTLAHCGLGDLPGGALVQVESLLHLRASTSVATSSSPPLQAGACAWGRTGGCFLVTWLDLGHLRLLGEAANPGPLRISTSNPSGLRTKEELLLSLGAGIHQVSETHLSTATQLSTGRRLRQLAQAEHRQVRPLFGHPADLRRGSNWAGTWTGVATISDFPCESLQLRLPAELWHSGRIQFSLHHVGAQSIILASIYGFPRGPTWPAAQELTSQLLAFISEHLVVGYNGLAVIAGDFNFSPGELAEMQLWTSYGWQEAQLLAHHRWHTPIQPTCKGSTHRDQLWLSPRLAALCSEVSVEDIFVDHSTVIASFDLSEVPHTYLTWPRPSEVPWTGIAVDDWHTHLVPPEVWCHQDATVYYQHFARQFEDSLDGHWSSQPGQPLPSRCKGRAQRTSPTTQLSTPPSCKAHRPGELALTYRLPGRAVLLWYKQLRRLQSYLHSIRKGTATIEATIYRAELWHCIRHAKGFKDGFPSWWNCQEFVLTIGEFPLFPPSRNLAEVLFATFLQAFREFETWHFNQRLDILKAKRQATMEGLFQDLRPPGREQVDCLWRDEEFTPLLEADDEGVIHLDEPATLAKNSIWLLDGLPAAITPIADTVVLVDMPSVVSDCSSLTQRIFASTTGEIHEALGRFWQDRWYLSEPPSQEAWTRITAFTQAFMPMGRFSFGPITINQWRASVKRFKPRAARGADGFGKQDLQFMTDSQILALLSLLEAIETGQAGWPTQMLEAFVIALAKKDCSHTPDHFRPIALLSIVYRCWSSLRARQFLRQLIAYIHTDAYGFLPEKETAQIWLLLQAHIECCLQAAMPLGGLSTDVVKAFNHIQRPPLFFLAAHVGAPPRLLQPWADFLVGLRRRFIVHNELGEAYLSNVGFPEGDPLSTAAMALLDWSMHVYQSRFAPSARTYSFVDNISIAGHQAQHVAMAYFSLQAFMALWGLLLDFSKTYLWGTTSDMRSQLRPLGLPLYEDALELGGALSFGAAWRNRLLRAKGTKLEDCWTRLRRSTASLAFKLKALPIVCWNKALHGSEACPLGLQHLQALRRQATSALGLRVGGANPLLRLSLSEPPTAEPAFFLLVRVVDCLRRLCFKSPELLDRWQSFMRAYSGRTLPGPFTRLVTCLSEVGWSVTAPPLVLDHDGFEHDLLALPRQAVHELLLDGWLQHVAHIVNKRHTMSDLAGMDTYLSRLDHDQLTAKQLAQTLALKEGAFISAWHQAKFDCTKQAFCAFCRVADHPGHWLSCPRFQDLRLHNPELTEAAGCWPQCTVHHLLVPRADFAFELKEYFLQLPAPGDFLSKPEEGLQELFTDGSSIDFVPGYIRAAAWAIQNATTGQPVATGHLTGLLQTVNRAELTAILVCVRWVLNFRARARIWTDSKYAHNWLRAGLELHVSQVPPSVDNHDLINELLADTALLDQGQLEIRWLPSHLALERCETASEEWAVLWNDQADRQAIRSNLDRSDTFWRLVARGQERVDTWVPFLRDLRRFHLEVGDHLRTAQTDEADQVVDDTPWEEVVQHCSLDARLPEAWMSTFQLFKSDRVAEYAHWLLEAIRPLQDESADFLPVSFIELTLYLFEREDFTIPHVREGQDLLIAPRRLFNRPTLARMVHAVRGAVREVCDFFDLSCYLTRGPRLESHIFLPCDCLILRPRPEVRSQLRELTSTFSGGRGIRKTADLARPPPSDRR